MNLRIFSPFFFWEQRGFRFFVVKPSWEVPHYLGSIAGFRRKSFIVSRSEPCPLESQSFFPIMYSRRHSRHLFVSSPCCQQQRESQCCCPQPVQYQAADEGTSNQGSCAASRTLSSGTKQSPVPTRTQSNRWDRFLYSSRVDTRWQQHFGSSTFRLVQEKLFCTSTCLKFPLLWHLS